MLNEEQNKNFGEKFVERYLSLGFGAMTKTEIDILVFHLLSESEHIKSKANYDISNKLQITESKVKSLRLNAALKYNQANHKAVLANIVTRITEEMAKPEFQSGVVTITIENPVEQRELEHAIKSVGRNIEYGLNKELLKISPIALFELVVSNLENPEQEFESIIQANIDDQAQQNTIINSTLSLRQRINKVGEEITEKASLISLLGAACGAL
jgi:DNA-binding CsgD family transcriptional regulator